jgi:hypothetical protein
LRLPLLRDKRRRWLLAGLLVPVGLWAAAAAVRPGVERRLAARIESEARRRGLLFRAEELHAGLFPLVRMRGVTLTNPGRFRLVAREIGVGLAPWGHGLHGLAWRVSAGRAALSLPAGVELRLAPSGWHLQPTGVGWRCERRVPGDGLSLEWQRSGDAPGLRLAAQELRLSEFVELRRGGAVLRDLGVVTGEARLTHPDADHYRLTVRGQGHEMRFGTIARAAEAPSPTPDAGAAAESLATEGEVELAMSVAPRQGDVTLDAGRLSAGGVVLAVRGAVSGVPEDPELDVYLSVERVDFARLLATAGLELPPGVTELGSASMDVEVRGRVRDPKSFVVVQHVDFKPPLVPIPALERLRGSFVHVVDPSRGPSRRIVVGPESPDFAALGDVPPLFIRALTLAEDSNFYGHRGLDFAEMPVALATNWLRGTTARGASTISQQLAKNLFLTREKSVSRKLSEAALALLLDATLGKERVLEIYLNIIEWGPDLYGLRPAARRYFGKDPAQLTPKEMAFLVALIPGPVKYQRSFADGALSPAFESLVDGVLAKLRSVEAIDEGVYQEALGESLLIRPNGEGLPDEELDAAMAEAP